VRCNLSAFFHYLRRRRIRSLNMVTPKTISGCLTELQTRRTKSGGRVTGNVRLFFDWRIFTGKRRLLNPVIPKFHTSVTTTRLPRPYEPNEMEEIRTLAEQSGDIRLCLAIAIGEESGLLISEICNLRLHDVDLEKYRLFVRLRNKTSRERFASFHTRTPDPDDHVVRRASRRRARLPVHRVAREATSKTYFTRTCHWRSLW